MRPRPTLRALLAALAVAGVFRAAAGLAALSLASLPLAGCSALMEAAGQRLALFGIGFDVRKVDVSRLVFPSSIFGIADLGRYGVDVRVSIRARNAKPGRAVFDGAAAKLRVQETSSGDPAATGNIPAFTVEGNSETVFDATFPLRLDSPIFGKDVWRNVVRGKDIPYKVEADLAVRFPGGMPAAVKTIPVTVVASQVNVRESSGPVIEGLMKAIDLAF